MNKEDYVSLEVAKLLKEKGYEGVCSGCYYKGQLWQIKCWNQADMFEGKFFAAPTLYDVQNRLREKNNIFIIVEPHYSQKYEVLEYEYKIATYFDLLEEPNKWKKSEEYYEKYEQCLNDAILEALKLI